MLVFSQGKALSQLGNQIAPASAYARETWRDLPQTRKSLRPRSRGLRERERLPENTEAVLEAVTGHLLDSTAASYGVNLEYRVSLVSGLRCIGAGGSNRLSSSAAAKGTIPHLPWFFSPS